MLPTTSSSSQRDYKSMRDNRQNDKDTDNKDKDNKHSTSTTSTTSTTAYNNNHMFGKIKPVMSSPSPPSSTSSNYSTTTNNNKYTPTNHHNTSQMPPTGQVILEEVISDDEEVRDALFPPSSSNLPNNQQFFDSPLTPIKSRNSKTPRRWRLVPANCTCVVHDNSNNGSSYICKKCSNGSVTDQKPPIVTPLYQSSSSSSSSRINQQQGGTPISSRSSNNHPNNIFSTHQTTPLSSNERIYYPPSPSYPNGYQSTTSSHIMNGMPSQQHQFNYGTPTKQQQQHFISPSKRQDYPVYPSGDYEREMQLLKSEVNDLEDEFDHLKRSTLDKSSRISNPLLDLSQSREREEIYMKKVEVENEIRETQQKLFDQVAQLKEDLKDKMVENGRLSNDFIEIHEAYTRLQGEHEKLASDHEQLFVDSDKNVMDYNDLLGKLQEYERELESRAVDSELLTELEQHVDTIRQALDAKIESMDVKDALISSKKSEMSAMEQARKSMADEATSQAKAEVLLEELTNLHHRLQELETVSQLRVDDARGAHEHSEMARKRAETKIETLSIELTAIRKARDEVGEELRTTRAAMYQAKHDCEVLQLEVRKLRNEEELRKESMKGKVVMSSQELDRITSDLEAVASNERILMEQVQELRDQSSTTERQMRDMHVQHINIQEESQTEMDKLKKRIQELIDENDDMRERLSKVHIVIENSPRKELSKEQIDALTPSKYRSPFIYTSTPTTSQQQNNFSNSYYQSHYKPPPISSTTVVPNNTPVNNNHQTVNNGGKITMQDLNSSMDSNINVNSPVPPIRQHMNEKWDSIVSRLKTRNSISSKDPLTQSSSSSTKNIVVQQTEIEKEEEEEEFKVEDEIKENHNNHQEEEEDDDDDENINLNGYNNGSNSLNGKYNTTTTNTSGGSSISTNHSSSSNGTTTTPLKDDIKLDEFDQDNTSLTPLTPMSLPRKPSSIFINKKNETMSPSFLSKPLIVNQVDENQQEVFDKDIWDDDEQETENKSNTSVLDDTNDLLSKLNFEDDKQGYLLNQDDFDRPISPSSNLQSSQFRPLNEIDKLLFNHVRKEVKTPISRIDQNGNYKLGNSKITLKVRSGELVVRVGGGYEKFTNFIERCKRTGTIELYKDKKHKKHFDQEIKNFIEDSLRNQKENKEIGTVTFVRTGNERRVLIQSPPK